MAQRVNLSPTGLPVRKKTFVAKVATVITLRRPNKGLLMGVYQ